jgi:N-acetylglutamate synthase-like GNAT family acetyltransferase
MTAMTSAVLLRPATKRDLPLVLALLAATGLPADGAESWIDHFVVAERDGAVVAS